MKSTLLLLKMLRWKIALSVVVCFVTLLILSIDMRPSAVDKGFTITGLSLILSFILMGISGIYTDLYRMPAPVTYRQLAWVPTVCLALCLLACWIGVFVGMFGLSPRVHDLSLWEPVLRGMVKSLPLLFFMFCVMDRIMRAWGFGRLGVLLLYNPMFQWPSIKEDGMLIDVYSYSWPLCIVMGILFILEGPYHVAAMEHPQLTQQAVRGMSVRKTGTPRKHPLWIVLGDTFLILIGVISISYMIFVKVDFSLLSSFGNYVKFYSVLMIILLFLGIRYNWRITGAHGAGNINKKIIFLMNCTIVLIPFANYLGVKRGSVGVCTNCTRYKFLWAPQCPQCGDKNQGSPLSEGIKIPGKGDKALEQPKQKALTGHMMFRGIIPIYLLIFGLATSSGVFYKESFSVFLYDDGEDAPVGTAEEIKAYLSAQEDISAWLNSTSVNNTELPDQYRIVVTTKGSQLLEIECFYLRWEDNKGMAENIRTQLLNDFSHISVSAHDQVSKHDYHSVRVNPWKLRTYLDGGIYWGHWQDKFPEEMLGPKRVKS